MKTVRLGPGELLEFPALAGGLYLMNAQDRCLVLKWLPEQHLLRSYE